MSPGTPAARAWLAHWPRGDPCRRSSPRCSTSCAGARARPSWSSRTCTGPTRRPWTARIPGPAGRRGCRALMVLTYRDDEVAGEAPLRRVLGGLRSPGRGAGRARRRCRRRRSVRLAGRPGRGAAGARLDRRQSVLRHRAARGRARGTPGVGQPRGAGAGGAAAFAHPRVARPARRRPGPCGGRAAGRAVPGLAGAGGGGRGARDGRVARGRRGVSARAGPSRRRGGAAGARGRGHCTPGCWPRCRRCGGDPARLVHHAERAGDVDTLVEVAPAAARAAAAAGAHREATAHYRRALELARPLRRRERADLLEAFTVEASTTCRIGEALRAAERALALREEQGDPTGVGRNLRWLSQLSWFAGRREDMERRLAAALDVLENQPPGPERAMAYSDLALRIGLYGGRREEAEGTAERAVALAETCGEPRRARARAGPYRHAARAAGRRRRSAARLPGPRPGGRAALRRRDGLPGAGHGAPPCAAIGRPPGAGSTRASSTCRCGKSWARCSTCAACRRCTSSPTGTGLLRNGRPVGCWPSRRGAESPVSTHWRRDGPPAGAPGPRRGGGGHAARSRGRSPRRAACCTTSPRPRHARPSTPS